MHNCRKYLNFGKYNDIISTEQLYCFYLHTKMTIILQVITSTYLHQVNYICSFIYLYRYFFFSFFLLLLYICILI